MAEALAELIAGEPEAWRGQIAAIGRQLAEMLIERELALAEINPLFVSDAGCVAGDAKLVVDLSAVERQPRIAALIEARPGIYADANRKLREGFDYVELDPDGEIGLVTTGAGLSMMLIDELTARGMKPLNFCDIRTGQMRGSPARLMRVLEWITSRPSLRAVLVNMFAGITDLAEFGGLLATAIEQTPALRVPVVARLVGRGAAEARAHPGGAAARRCWSPRTWKRRCAHRRDPRGSARMIGSAARADAGDRAGHHRPHGPHPRGADARLRHQHRRRHLDAHRHRRRPPACRCSPPAATRCWRPARWPRSPWRRRWKRWPRSRKRWPPASG